MNDDLFPERASGPADDRAIPRAATTVIPVSALVARARLYVDSRAAALVESGDVVMGMADGLFTATHIRGELGEVVLGRAEGRRSDGDVTVFKSLGMAVEDVVAADLVLRRAVETGAGTELTL